MIQGFKNKFTEQIVEGSIKKGFPPNLIKRAQQTVFALDQAIILRDLRFPPGNKLHALKENRAGYHAIWINDKWRVCFKWTSQGPDEVEITDYHD